ncbi:hypothetical protein G6F47_008879 [Rhizopus delemar]|nr:hypothetical protein G6F54_003142 [Rhizopus delemar]KAG1512045.1 hypothetical protein G6F53_005477 [Rhizopus delemar]KAG1594176.1 hypothetical protein G6F47_008879 [Rhizopus delemar]
MGSSTLGAVDDIVSKSNMGEPTVVSCGDKITTANEVILPLGYKKRGQEGDGVEGLQSAIDRATKMRVDLF